MRAPAASRSSGVSALTVACVPTGMKTGVSTTPWAVVRRPRRAAPSVASRWNVMGSITGEAWRGVSYDQHGVAVRVEAVAGCDGVVVRAQQGLAAGEGGGQEQQRRARQVKVRQQRVDHAEPVARTDGEVGNAVEGPHAPRLVGRAL